MNSNQSILSDINLSLEDSKTFEELSTKIQNDISKIDNQILELFGQMKKIDETLVEKETLTKSIGEKLEISEHNLLKYQSLDEYKETREYFINELNSNNTDKSILLGWMSNIQLTLNN